MLSRVEMCQTALRNMRKICVFTRLPKQVLNEVCYTGISRTDETENRLHKYRKADFTEMDSTCLERVEVCSKPVRSKFSNCFSDVHVVLQCLHIWLVLRTWVQTYMILYVDFYNTFHCSGSDYLIDPIKPSQIIQYVEDPVVRGELEKLLEELEKKKEEHVPAIQEA